MDHLPAQEAKHVINLLSGLFLYAYRTKNKKAKVTMDNMEHLCHVGSTILFRNEQASRRLIESSTSGFIHSCQRRMPPVLHGFKAAVSSSCMSCSMSRSIPL